MSQKHHGFGGKLSRTHYIVVATCPAALGDAGVFSGTLVIGNGQGNCVDPLVASQF